MFAPLGSSVLTVLRKAGLGNGGKIFRFMPSYFVVGEGGPSPVFLSKLMACCTLTCLLVRASPSSPHRAHCLILPVSLPDLSQAHLLLSMSRATSSPSHGHGSCPVSTIASRLLFQRPVLTASQIHSPFCRHRYLFKVQSNLFKTTTDFSLLLR